MVQDVVAPSEQKSNNKYHSSLKLHITFHNPNTTEETAKYLAKLIAKNILDQASFSRERG